MNHSTPGLPVHHQLPEFTQTHVHWVGDAIQPSHPLSSPSPPAFNLSQHQGLFQWVSSSHQVAKKNRYIWYQWITLLSKVHIVKAALYSSHVWMWELDHKEGWVPKNWCFWTVVLETTLESLLDFKEIQSVHSKGDRPWLFFGRNDTKAETILHL